MEKPMADATKKPFWKRAIWFLIKLYAALCTLLVTAIFIPGLLSKSDQGPCYSLEDVQSQYKSYMSSEFPKRSEYFQQLASELSEYGSKGSSVSMADVRQYLGEPDHVFGGSNTGIYIYYFQQQYLTTNRWYYVMDFSGGKLSGGGLSCNPFPPEKNPPSKPH